MKSGERAELVAYGPFAADPHLMFANRAGIPIWWPKLEQRLKDAALPTEVIDNKWAARPTMVAPPASGFAPLDDVSVVPHLDGKGRRAYATFLGRAAPRAFAISPDGFFGWWAGGNDPLEQALSSCARRAKEACQLYAVDADVVWKTAP